MNLLLDTHVFLWWISGSERLPGKVRTAVGRPTNTTFLSVVSIWEISIKCSIGKLKLAVPPRELIAKHLKINYMLPLAISPEHALTTYDLDLHHGDPFDRLLIAQAKVEELTLVTADSRLYNYPVATLWE